MAGRPRKSADEHKLNGTYRPVRHGPLSEPFQKYLSGDGDLPPPEKPDGLSPVAGEMWDRVLKTAPGRVWAGDAPLLEVYCEWWSLWRKTLLLAQGEEGGKSLVPLGIITDKLEKLGAKFGLSPKDRAGLPVEEVGPKKAKVESRPQTKLDRMKPPKK